MSRVIKFGTSGMLCEELRAKELQKYCRITVNVCTHGKFLEYIHTEVTNVMSTVYTTLDYEYRHKNKGTGIALVPKKCGVYK